MKDTILWKKIKNNHIKIKEASLKNKQIKLINKILKKENIAYSTLFENIAPYIKSYKENTFKTYEMTMEELHSILFPNSIDIDSRFSIISDKEIMKMPEPLKNK